MSDREFRARHGCPLLVRTFGPANWWHSWWNQTPGSTMRAHRSATTLIDAAPSKRIYLSIIADYDLNRSVCELVDNALDAWREHGRTAPLQMSILIDTTQQSILVTDDAGGVSRGDLKYLVSPGDSLNTGRDPSIGYFGVGSKRAAVALAMTIRISTRVKGAPGFRLEYDEEWLADEDNWELPVTLVDGLQEGTTITTAGV